MKRYYTRAWSAERRAHLLNVAGMVQRKRRDLDDMLAPGLVLAEAATWSA